LKEGSSEERNVAIAYLAFNDPFYLAKKILRYDRMYESIHRPMVERACNLDNKRSLELLPRGIYKTTVRTILKSIYILIRDPNAKILICMNSATNAQRTLSEIKAQLERNTRFKKFFGDWCTGSTRWQGNSIVIAPRTIGSKEGSIDVIGKDTSITSMHYDYILIDDIVDERDRDSEAVRRDTRLFFEDIQDLLNPNGTIDITGTRWHFDDLYGWIVNDLNEDLDAKGLKGYHTVIKPVKNSEGDLNFPQMFSESKLDQLLAEKGIVSFSSQYMLNPISEGTQIFPQDNAGWFDVRDFNPDEGISYGYCDPALGENKRACMAPIIIAYYMHAGKYEGKILILESDNAVRPVTKTVERIVELHDEYRTATFGLEDNGAQKLLLQDVDELARKISAERNEIFLIPIKGVTNTANKDARIERFERHYSSKRVLFRRDYATAPNNYKELLMQLWQYPAAKYKDCPDAIDSLVERIILGGKLHVGIMN